MRAVEPGGRHWAMLNVEISRRRIGDVNTVEWGYWGQRFGLVNFAGC